MSRRRSDTALSPLELRLQALKEATELGDQRLGTLENAASWAVLDRAASRRTLSSEHTVVGFFGATGSGKSSLFNAVVGEDLARVAATRPTTGKPLAAVWGAKGSDPLLDWLEVTDRRVIDSPLHLARKGIFGSAKEAYGLILLDLPDFDSTVLAHRETATKLAGQVDVLVWVLDPQKYADAAVHHDFIKPLSAHGAVTLVVLNQVDKLGEAQRQPVLASLRSILERDGLAGPRVLGVSAVTGEGVEGLRQEIAKVVTERSAASNRLAADVATMAEQLGRGHAIAELTKPSDNDRRDLVRNLAAASGVDTVVDAVRTSYRLDARKRTGWPLTRWLSKMRPDPLRRLNLKSAEVNPAVNRTSLPAAGVAQRAQADTAVRRYAEVAGAAAPEPWKASIRRASRGHTEELPDLLDQAIAKADVKATKGAWWWPLISVVQWIALATALAGALWLGALAAVQYLQFTLPPAPRVEGFPVPTLMLLGGILLGVVLGILSGFAARVGAAGRARSAKKALLGAVESVVEETVIGPVNAEINRHNQFIGALQRARG
ncbi:GTPase family protein [Paeniglutamicibacter sp. R2-26]|uniref:GTPase family protein n=1 Tax=Paeniglutamicibacter sp. R2-26 TaxID=3144417 RepID=UPI003EE67E27